MKHRVKIVLASSSPRRRRLLEQIRIPFSTIDPVIEEITSGRAEERVIQNAVAKASKASEQIKEGIIVGADTVVEYEDKVLGKPSDYREAEVMLRTLSGNVHRVLTGIAVIDAVSNRLETDVVKTHVKMRVISDDEITAYIETGEPLGKAGGYAIQSVGGLLIEEVHGCFYNVVGLPLSRLDLLLKRFNISILETDSDKIST
jgi:septum formation protein